ncbi:hypothetical protein [Flavobacterium sp. CF136]|uniref:hypothetical protein n=1 Tax=Flavobacterium sp. (strain CF136) TaxID=1144313 RepID=UPI0002718E33|nr:hypothetical protein [Flavobacterium sp. CF136]EJL62796.1 hypothetical protein PMI10_02753 [Flavobacterium sp. CF136]
MILNTQIIKSVIEVNVPLKEVFVSVFHYDLMKFFKRLPCSPVFTYSAFKIESFRPGFEHTIYFLNGNGARRRLVSFLPEISFLVSIDNFKTGSYIGLCEIEYQYYFSQSKSRQGITVVCCEYRFMFRYRITEILFCIFYRRSIQNHLDAFLAEISVASQKDFFSESKI